MRFFSVEIRSQSGREQVAMFRNYVDVWRIPDTCQDGLSASPKGAGAVFASAADLEYRLAAKSAVPS